MSKERAAQLVDAGIWLKLSGDLEGARKLFERAHKLDPQNEKAKQLLEGADGAPAPAPPSSPRENPFEPPAASPPAPNQQAWNMAMAAAPPATSAPSDWGRAVDPAPRGVVLGAMAAPPPPPARVIQLGSPSPVPAPPPASSLSPMNVHLGSPSPVPATVPAPVPASSLSPMNVHLGSPSPVPAPPPAPSMPPRSVQLGSPSPVPAAPPPMAEPEAPVPAPLAAEAWPAPVPMSSPSPVPMIPPVVSSELVAKPPPPEPVPAMGWPSTPPPQPAPLVPVDARRAPRPTMSDWGTMVPGEAQPMAPLTVDALQAEIAHSAAPAATQADRPSPVPWHTSTPAPSILAPPAQGRTPTPMPARAPTPAPVRTPTPAPTRAPTPTPAPVRTPTPAPTRAPRMTMSDWGSMVPGEGVMQPLTVDALKAAVAAAAPPPPPPPAPLVPTPPVEHVARPTMVQWSDSGLSAATLKAEFEKVKAAAAVPPLVVPPLVEPPPVPAPASDSGLRRPRPTLSDWGTQIPGPMEPLSVSPSVEPVAPASPPAEPPREARNTMMQWKAPEAEPPRAPRTTLSDWSHQPALEAPLIQATAGQPAPPFSSSRTPRPTMSDWSTMVGTNAPPLALTTPVAPSTVTLTGSAPEEPPPPSTPPLFSVPVSQNVTIGGDPGPEVLPPSTPPLFAVAPSAEPVPPAAELPLVTSSVSPPPEPPRTYTEPMGYAWGWSGSQTPPVGEEIPEPRPSPSLAPNARSAWDARSNPGIKLEAVTGQDRALDLITSDSKLTKKPGKKEEVAALLKAARDLIGLDDHTGAMQLIDQAEALAPDDAEVLAMKDKSQKTLLTMFESKLGSLEATPRVLLKDDEIIWLNLDHRAGFVLAQIDGTVTFDDLFNVSGMSRIDTARILAQLVEEGVISRG